MDKSDSIIGTPVKHTPLKERRQSPVPYARYRSENTTHSVMNIFRETATLPLALAIDKMFLINPQDVGVLSKSELVEVLDLMYNLNKRREQLTVNRMQLVE